MNKQVRSILAQETTKTSKIRQLYLLGIPRAEIARMVTNGNYGFVVNALRRMNEREGGLNIHPATAALDYTFSRSPSRHTGQAPSSPSPVPVTRLHRPGSD